MNSTHLFVFCLLSIIIFSDCSELKCEFKKYKTDGYNCKASELKIDKANLKLTSVTGKHELLATDEDVEVFYILQNYEIQYLPVGLSNFFPKLKKYDVQRSTLKYIANGDFAELINLTTIEIFRTAMEFIPEDTFWTLTKLEILNLRDNKLISLEEDTFKDLVNLKNLLLQDNKLTYLLSTFFQTNINLVEVDFARNQLRIIDSDTFSNSIKIKNLNFDQNICIKKKFENVIDLTEIKNELLISCSNPLEPIIKKYRDIKQSVDEVYGTNKKLTQHFLAFEITNAQNIKTIKECENDNDRLDKALKVSNNSLVNLQSTFLDVNKNVSQLNVINVQLQSNLTTVLNDKQSAINNTAREQQESDARNQKLKHEYTDLYERLIKANQTIARMADRNDNIKNNLTDAIENLSILHNNTSKSFQKSLELQKNLKATLSSLKLYRNSFYISCSFLSIILMLFLFMMIKKYRNENDYKIIDSRIKFVNGMETVDAFK